ncbi:hypothetical protein C8J56DRAFT_887639 [Mycena floridula]|nr:hypothetical protein C8J56DRAFT_887639 [Mycena floridula]
MNRQDDAQKLFQFIALELIPPPPPLPAPPSASLPPVPYEAPWPAGYDEDEDIDLDPDLPSTDKSTRTYWTFPLHLVESNFTGDSPTSANWAPVPKAELIDLSHLPGWQQSPRFPTSRSPSVTASRRTSYTNPASPRSIRQSNGLSGALPNPLVQRDVDFTLRALINIDTFSQLVNDPLGRQRFREFLPAEGDTAELDFWTRDTHHYSQSVEQVRLNGEAFQVQPKLILRALPLWTQRCQRLSNFYIKTRYPEHTTSILGCRQLFEGYSTASLAIPISESVPGSCFSSVIALRQAQNHPRNHVSLSSDDLSDQKLEGLGECFALTNPRLPDHPLIGRNCRFLQGPGTSLETVSRIRDGLNSGQGRNGEPFYCLFCIIPIRDTKGDIVHFIGGQTNVTGLLDGQRISYIFGN